MTGCRIGRIKLKAGGEFRVIHSAHQNNRLIETLVTILDKARRGQVRSFALVVRIERDDESMSWIEAADVMPSEEGGDLNMLLGGIERMKHRLIIDEPTQEPLLS